MNKIKKSHSSHLKKSQTRTKKSRIRKSRSSRVKKSRSSRIRKSRSSRIRKSRSSRVKKSSFLNLCRSYLSDKIKQNIREYKLGRYVSRNQAIAVSYSQLKKISPKCSNVLSIRK